MTFWDSTLSSYIQCQFKDASFPGNKDSNRFDRDSGLYTSTIIHEANNKIKCQAPTTSVGKLQLSLIDTVRMEELTENNEVEIFEKLQIQSHLQLMIYNESMNFRIDTEYNLAKLANLDIKCLLNDKMVGVFKIIEELAYCQYHNLQFKEVNNIQL